MFVFTATNKAKFFPMSPDKLQVTGEAVKYYRVFITCWLVGPGPYLWVGQQRVDPWWKVLSKGNRNTAAVL
jgi:hypothetical protein